MIECLFQGTGCRSSREEFNLQLHGNKSKWTSSVRKISMVKFLNDEFLIRLIDSR